MARWSSFFIKYALGVLLLSLAMYILFPHIQIIFNRPHNPNYWSNFMTDFGMAWPAYLSAVVIIILYGLLWYADEKRRDKEFKAMMDLLQKIAQKLGVDESEPENKKSTKR